MLPERVSALASVEKILSSYAFHRDVIFVGNVICGIREVELILLTKSAVLGVIFIF